jgi:hypothetical protein
MWQSVWHNRRRVSYIAEALEACQEGICFMALAAVLFTVRLPLFAGCSCISKFAVI